MINNLLIFNLNFIWIVLPIFVILFIGFSLIFYKQKQILGKLVHEKNVQIIFPGRTGFKGFITFVFFSAGLILLFFLFLRIQWGGEEIKLDQGGRNILFALDISRSMLATDVSSNNIISRLEFAKLKIKSLVKDLGPERIGLLLFADKHVLQCPFTKDFKNFFAFLNQIDSLSVSSSSTTQISNAFLGAIDIFEQAKVKSKILIILTDGEDFGENAIQVFERAKQENISLFAFGIGSEAGAPVPILDSLGKIIGHEKDSSGKIILTKLNQKRLDEIVSYLGGESRRASFDNTDILAAKNLIQKIEKEKFDEASFILKKESYPFFAIASGLFFILESLTRIL